MLKPESVQENETHKIYRYFEIQTDNLISSRRPDLVKVNKKGSLPTSGFCHLPGSRIENQRKRKEREVHGPCQRTEKAMEHESDCDTNCN